MFCLWEWRFLLPSSPLIKFYHGDFLLVFYNQLWKTCAKNISAITYSLQFLYSQPFTNQFSIMRKYNPDFLCFVSKQLKMIIINSIHHFNATLVVEKKKQENKYENAIQLLKKGLKYFYLNLTKEQTYKCKKNIYQRVHIFHF